MDTNVRLGIDCVLYAAGSASGNFNTSITGIGTGGAPSFTELDNVQDVTVNLAKGEATFALRGAGGMKLTRGALKEVSFDVTVPYIRGDAKREGLYGAYLAGSLIGMVMLDGPINSASSKGLAIDMEVLAASAPQPNDGILIQTFTMKPCLPGTDTNGTFSKACQIAGSAGGTLTVASQL